MNLESAKKLFLLAVLSLLTEGAVGIGSEVAIDEPDSLSSAQLCLTLAERQDLHAQEKIRLGDCLLNGPDRESSFQQAISLFLEAAELGEPDGWARAGQWLIFNARDNSQRDAAISHMETALARGSTHVTTALAMLRLVGRGVDRDPELGMAMLGERAKAADARAISVLAYLYSSGTHGIVRDSFAASVYLDTLAAVLPHTRDESVRTELFASIAQQFEKIGVVARTSGSSRP